jgi:hypothetical protein
MKRNGRNAAQGNEAERASRRATSAPEPEQPHRLRGGELEDDFADADADSCVVAHHRDEKESDS